MKTLCLIAALAVLAGPVGAEEYTIGFFTDENASACEITNITPEVIRIHMLLYGDAGTANTVELHAPTPACWDATWLGDEINDDYLFLGTTHGDFGVTITFKGCRTLPVRLGSMSFWATGSTPCCTYETYPLRSGNDAEAVTCAAPGLDAYMVPAGHESVMINPDAGCTCTPSSVVAVEETTWGQVKALYR